MGNWFNTCVALVQLSSAAFSCCWCFRLSDAVIGAAQDLLELMESSTEANTSCSLDHTTPPPGGRKRNCTEGGFKVNTCCFSTIFQAMVSFRSGYNTVKLFYSTSAAQWRFSHNCRSSVYFWDAPGHPVGQQVWNQGLG